MSVQLVEAIFAALVVASTGFSYNSGTINGKEQRSLKPKYSNYVAEPAAEAVWLEDQDHPFTGRSFAAPLIGAFRGLSLSIAALVTLYSIRHRKYKRVWKAKVRSNGMGREAVRAKWRGPGILGRAEKPPHEKQKMYHYYCNKIYKVIRESSSSDVETAPPITTEQFISPAVWNTPVFRAAAVVSGGVLVGGVLPFTAMLHLSAFGIWLGANVWTTFIAGITMFKNLPKQQFGSLQAKLFPKYFQLGAACTALLLITATRLNLPVGAATVSLVATLANLLFLEPKATAIMFERYDRENKGVKDAAKDSQLKANFGKLHGLSSLANLVALVALVSHGVLLSSRL